MQVQYSISVFGFFAYILYTTYLTPLTVPCILYSIYYGVSSYCACSNGNSVSWFLKKEIKYNLLYTNDISPHIPCKESVRGKEKGGEIVSRSLSLWESFPKCVSPDFPARAYPTSKKGLVHVARNPFRWKNPPYAGVVPEGNKSHYCEPNANSLIHP